MTDNSQIVYQCPLCLHTVQKPGDITCEHLYFNYHEIDLERTSTAILFTIGYNGKSMDTFLSILKAYQVAYVLDTRYTPLSHKPGFSTGRLSATLRDNDTSYGHLQALGSPKPLRVALHDTGDYGTFFAAYRQHLMQQSAARWAVQALMADRQRVALLCAEENPAQCHRSVLAEVLVEQSERQGIGKPRLVHL